jgi:DNA-binding NarL/FixJ family response regulator
MQEKPVISPKRARVLLVEDSVHMIKVLTHTVNSIPGLELVAVADGASEGILQFAKCQPNIVILDLDLSSGDGLQVLHEIKRHPSPCLVLIFTALDSDSFRITCMQGGAYRFFSKAREHQEMVRLLRHLGGERSEQSSLEDCRCGGPA